jgi:hypothetical protein
LVGSQSYRGPEATKVETLYGNVYANAEMKLLYLLQTSRDILEAADVYEKKSLQLEYLPIRCLVNPFI